MRIQTFLSILCLAVLSFTVFTALPTKAALAWNVQTLDEEVWAGGNCPLVLDPNGTAHMVYPSARTDGVDMIYASYDGLNWTDQTIQTGNSGFKKPIDLAIDAKGKPYLLYVHHPYGAPAVASWNGKNWTIQVIGSTYAGEAVLALDSFWQSTGSLHYRR